jgi:ribose-phosphate pyrophosphokinase
MYYRLLALLLFCFSGLHAQEFKLFSGTANTQLASSIAKILNIPCSKIGVGRFSDGEIKIQINESVRNRDVFIVQSTCLTPDSSVNDNVMELYLIIRAMKRASAKNIHVIIPYFGYARQDRKSESRVPISASDLAMLLESAGADHVIAVDLHCGQIQGFFHDIPVDNLFASSLFVPYVANKDDLIDPVVVSPDAGGVERAKKFIEGLNVYGMQTRLAVIVKQRAGAGVVEKMNLVGSVEGSDVILIDDICDTAGTLVKAAQELKEHGARRIFACITHPVFSGSAVEKISRSALTELIVSDTIPPRCAMPENITQLSMAPLIAEAIRRTYTGESISHLFSYSHLRD